MEEFKKLSQLERVELYYSELSNTPIKAITQILISFLTNNADRFMAYADKENKEFLPNYIKALQLLADLAEKQDKS